MDAVDPVAKKLEVATIADDTQNETELPENQAQSQNNPQPEVGDNFDGDFGDDEDFGDFDDFDDFQEQDQITDSHCSADKPQSSLDFTQSSTPSAPPRQKIPCLTETDFSSSVTIQSTISSILSSSISADCNHGDDPTPPSFITESPMSYFNERSQSLWQQLALIQPQALATDWKKSTIRRLFMISLGVPLDLDEILPPTKTPKKLILPNNSKSDSVSTSTSTSATAAASLAAKTKTGDKISDNPLEINTAQNLSAWNHLAQVSDLALQGMSQEELTLHITELNTAIDRAAQTLAIWEAKKAAAEKDKQDFESLIESLVDYAQKVGRKKSVKKK